MKTQAPLKTKNSAPIDALPEYIIDLVTTR